MSEILKHCEEFSIPSQFDLSIVGGTPADFDLPTAFFEPTSNVHSLKVLRAVETLLDGTTSPPLHPFVTYSTPNIHELSTLYDRLQTSEHVAYDAGLWFDHINVSADLLTTRLPPWVVKEGVVPMAVRLLPVFGTLFVKSGNRGVLVVQRVHGVDAVAAWRAVADRKGTVVAASTARAEEAVAIRHYSALELDESQMGTVTGAGDNLAGAMLASIVRGLSPGFPADLDRIVEIAQK